MLNRGPDSLWSLKIPGCPSKKGVTPTSWPNFLIDSSDHHGLLIIPIHWLSLSLCLLSISKLVCGGLSGAIWLPSHHPGGCCTLVRSALELLRAVFSLHCSSISTRRTAHQKTPLSSSWSLQTTPHWSASFRMVMSLLTDRRLRSWLSGAI